ncbi:ATP-dependent helicase, partial [Proteus mirabilis]
MKFIRPDHWQPKGIDDLEPNAWQALRQRESTSIIAGPGAGKTEFLAQKAAYLLETGLCPSNKKILAISFKTDAAKNLADRVKERCSEEVSNRFISMTFDAFTKNLIDRFRMALPEHHRPSKRYEISFPSFHQEKQLISSFRNNFGNAVGIYSFTQRLQNMNQFIGSVRIGDPKLSWLEEEFLTFWLSQQINYPDGVSRVSFPALNRLAEYIVRTNDHVRRSIRASYPIVFVDEFQDTTFAQYDFLSSVFKSSEAEVTAVGDYKQRIMGWAGAKGDVFHQFEADFSAERHSLLLNHRSSPELVRIQHVIAQAIDHEVREV